MTQFAMRSACEKENMLWVQDLGRQPYFPVLALQEETLERRRRGQIPDTLFLVEHDPVYTLGRNGQISHLLCPPEVLRRRGAEVVWTNRGGDVTFHGPGQLVGYAIVHLAEKGLGVVAYVNALEEVLLRTLRAFGIAGQRHPVHRGVWVGPDKIAALGVRVSGGVSMHGFALNVAPDLRWFECIIPCGLRDYGVTSMDRFVHSIALEDAKAPLIHEFAVVFGYGQWRRLDPLVSLSNGGIG